MEALVPFLKTGTMAACFLSVGKYCWDRLRLKMFENRNEDLRTTLNNEARDTIKSDSLRRSKTFKGFTNFQLGNGGQRKIEKGEGIPVHKECYKRKGSA
jgi:hypothetical protein